MPDPYRNFRFRIEIDGKAVLSFSDVSGFDFTPRPAPGPRRIPGGMIGNLTFKRGVTISPDILNWLTATAGGSKIERKTLTICALDEGGNVSGRWQVVNGWPVKYSLSEFKGSGNETLIETLEIVHEGCTPV